MPPFYGDWLQSVCVLFWFFLVICYSKPTRLLLEFCIMQRMSLELIISAHVPFNTCSLFLWSQTLPPLSPSHPTSLSRFIPGCPLLFFFIFFFINAFPFFSLIPQWGACWLSSAPRCRWSGCRKKTPTWRRVAATRHLTVGQGGRWVYVGIYVVCALNKICQILHGAVAWDPSFYHFTHCSTDPGSMSKINRQIFWLLLMNHYFLCFVIIFIFQ